MVRLGNSLTIELTPKHNKMVNSALLLVVKIVASVSSMVLCLSPGPSTYTIHKQQKTGDVEFLPLVTFLLFCHEWYVLSLLVLQCCWSCTDG